MKLAALGDSNTGNNKNPYYVSSAQTYFKLVADALGYSDSINAGVSGNTATQMLNRVTADIVAFGPNVCFVMAGTNEADSSITYSLEADLLVATYSDALSGIITALQAANIKPVIISPPYSMRPRMEGRLQLLRDAAQNLCSARGVAFVDLFGRMQRDSETLTTAIFNAWYLDVGGAPDLYHMGVTGHQRLADLILTTQLQYSAATPASVNGSILATTLTGSFGNMDGSTARIKILAAATTPPTGPATKMRLKLQAHADEPFTVAKCYLGKCTSGVSVGSFVQLQVASSNAFTVPQCSSVWTDWVNIDWNKTADLVVSLYANGGSTADRMAAASGSAAGNTSLKSGDDAANITASGYADYSGYLSLVASIETDGF